MAWAQNQKTDRLTFAGLNPKKLFKYLLYLSLLFLAITLYRSHYLTVPHINSYGRLTLAFLFYFVSYFFVTFSWHQLLKKMDCFVSTSEAFLSFGLTIFMKYIPGKVSSLVGPLGYINTKRNYSLRRLSVIAVTDQLIVLWNALLFGMIGLFIINNVKLYGVAIFILWLAVTLLIFTRFFHNLAEKAVKKIFKKDVNIPYLNFLSALAVLPWYAAQWIFLCLAFYFFVGALLTGAIRPEVMLALPLASAMGMVAIIFPGGLGVREGFLTSFLTVISFDLPVATTIAVTSRLWLIAGEVIIFAFSSVMSKIKKSTAGAESTIPGASDNPPPSIT